MKTVSLRKLDTSALKVLQDRITEYHATVRLSTDFFTAIMLLDVTMRMWLLLRRKIETGRHVHTLTLKPHEAAALVKCCMDTVTDDPFARNVFLAVTADLDQQLKSL